MHRLHTQIYGQKIDHTVLSNSLLLTLVDPPSYLESKVAYNSRRGSSHPPSKPRG